MTDSELVLQRNLLYSLGLLTVPTLSCEAVLSKNSYYRSDSTIFFELWYVMQSYVTYATLLV